MTERLPSSSRVAQAWQRHVRFGVHPQAKLRLKPCLNSKDSRESSYLQMPPRVRVISVPSQARQVQRLLLNFKSL